MLSLATVPQGAVRWDAPQSFYLVSKVANSHKVTTYLVFWQAYKLASWLNESHWDDALHMASENLETTLNTQQFNMNMFCRSNLHLIMCLKQNKIKIVWSIIKGWLDEC